MKWMTETKPNNTNCYPMSPLCFAHVLLMAAHLRSSLIFVGFFWSKLNDIIQFGDTIYSRLALLQHRVSLCNYADGAHKYWWATLPPGRSLQQTQQWAGKMRVNWIYEYQSEAAEDYLHLSVSLPCPLYQKQQHRIFWFDCTLYKSRQVTPNNSTRHI